MATWSLVESLGSRSSALGEIASDYIDQIWLLKRVSSDTQVYVYDTVADTLTKISNFGVDVQTGPIYFGDELYCATYDDVYRYSGSGTIWNSVKALPGSSWEPKLARSATQLLLSLVQTIDVKEVHYSSDGTSWSEGTISSTPSIPSGAVSSVFLNWQNGNNTILPVFAKDGDGNDIGGTSALRRRVLQWTGTGLTTAFYYTRELGGTPTAGDLWVKSYDLQDILYWESSTNYSETMDGTFTTPSNPSPAPLRSLNFGTISWGIDSSSGNQYLYQLTIDGGGQWDAGEIVDTTTAITGIEAVIRMDNDNVYLVSYKSAGNGGIYTRSEPISDAPIVSSGSRLWIYKGDGVNWESRGIKTA